MEIGIYPDQNQRRGKVERYNWNLRSDNRQGKGGRIRHQPGINSGGDRKPCVNTCHQQHEKGVACIFDISSTALSGSSMRLASENLAPLRSAPANSAPKKSAFRRFAPRRLAPIRLAFVKLAPLRSALSRSTSFSLARAILAFFRFEPRNNARVRFFFPKSAPSRSAKLRSARRPSSSLVRIHFWCASSVRPSWKFVDARDSFWRLLPFGDVSVFSCDIVCSWLNRETFGRHDNWLWARQLPTPYTLGRLWQA